MRFFNFPKQGDINQGVEQYKSISEAVLLDVRTPQEYAQGHIPGSRNIPLQEMENIVKVVKHKEVPLFIYCLSGGRSRQAAVLLKRMGYTNVTNLGGISGYNGKVER